MKRKTDHIKRNQIEKRQQISLLSFLLLFICFLLVCVPLLQAAENQINSQKIEDILRQDILRFVGPISDTLNFTIPDDAYLVRLAPKRLVKSESGKLPPIYNMLIRNVDPVEKALFQDAQDGKWDNFNLFRAAMVAEGERDPIKIKNYEAKLDAILQKIKNKNHNNNNPVAAENLTRSLFEALHRDIMTRQYDINCTNISRVFETGKFNCVSATVLFNVIGEKAGLNVHALEMPGHALSRVRFSGKEIDLETTCPDWFKLENKEALAAATTQRVAQPESATPNPIAGNNADNRNLQDTRTESAKLADLSKKSREITPVQLIATIYYNHGVDLLNEKRYAEAAMVNIKALHLDPESETAQGNLMVAINNWALELSSGKTTNGIKRYDLAAILFDQGRYLDPSYEKFETNQLHIYYHWILDLAIKGRLDAAKEVFSYANKRLPDNPTLARLMNTILKQPNKGLGDKG
jgi:tetratricopeptide (TPR) repeat protein